MLAARCMYILIGRVIFTFVNSSKQNNAYGVFYETSITVFLIEKKKQIMNLHMYIKL